MPNRAKLPFKFILRYGKARRSQKSVLEGVAEFVAVKATGKSSTAPAISYGRVNDAKIKGRFATQMFNSFTGFWLYSNAANEFNQRDLGYYVGYAICEKYYEKAKDKKRAVSEMINLDYNDAVRLNRFVDQSGYFSRSIEKLKDAYERERPTVTQIRPFKNGATEVDPKTTELVIEFSVPMNNKLPEFRLRLAWCR